MTTIEINYEAGETAWYMKNNKPAGSSIIGFKVICTYQGYNDGGWGSERTFPIKKFYLVNRNPEIWLPDNELFKTKQDLINSL